MLGIDTINRLKDGHLVYHFLLASYCYYQLDMSPMTDHAFDRLCVRLRERWDFIDPTIYPHRELIEYDALEAGTCMMAEEEYPLIVRCSAYRYIAICHSGQLARDLEPHLLPETLQPIAKSPPRIRRSAPVHVTVKPGRIVRTPPKGSP